MAWEDKSSSCRSVETMIEVGFISQCRNLRAAVPQLGAESEATNEGIDKLSGCLSVVDKGLAEKEP